MAYTDIAREIDCRIIAYDGIMYYYYYSTSEIMELTLDRNAEGKFFGVSVAQKLTVKLRNSNNDIALKIGDSLAATLYQGSPSTNAAYLGKFYITEVSKDENTNALTLTAYDAIYFLAEHTLNEINTNYNSISSLLDGLVATISNISSWDYTSKVEEDTSAFTYTYSGDNIINFNGTETLRDVLTRICEATQTIAYIDSDELTFTRLNPDEEEDATIPRSQYFTLKNNGEKTLTGIVSTTELGNNIGKEDQNIKDTTQYINENGFLNHISDADLTTKINSAFALLNGLEIYQIEMQWRGNPLVDYASKIKIEDKDGNYIYSYLLDDSLKYNGGLTQTTKWSYTDQQTTEYNPTSISSALTRASAKVDKVNGRIDLVVEDYNGQIEETKAQFTVQNNAIIASVEAVNNNAEAVQAALDDYITTNGETISGLDSQLSQVISSTEQLQTDTAYYFNVVNTLQDSSGQASYVQTTTATIDNAGITVSRSGSSLETVISENGMQVNNENTVELEANSQGVIAHNLTADNYLIIDGLIRFQKYGTNRVGCYWIGG